MRFHFHTRAQAAPNHVADLEIVFEEGPLCGLKLVGGSLWCSRSREAGADRLFRHLARPPSARPVLRPSPLRQHGPEHPLRLQGPRRLRVPRPRTRGTPSASSCGGFVNRTCTSPTLCMANHTGAAWLLHVRQDKGLIPRPCAPCPLRAGFSDLARHHEGRDRARCW
jgi:hypothetical protein